MPAMLYSHVTKDAKILDFGCGPLDKTFMFKSLTKNLYAFDTLKDTWHTVDNNDEKIKSYGRQSGIHFIDTFEEIGAHEYDVIMLHDVIEHFHDSPRTLLNTLTSYLKPGGLLVLTVPNAGNIRKRIHLLLGKTNYPRYGYFYWYPGKWDGHVREYVRGDLDALVSYLGLYKKDLRTFHIHLDILPPSVRSLWRFVSTFMPNTRDSFYLIAEKPKGWEPRLKPTDEEFSSSFGRQYFSKFLDIRQIDWT
nr:MULTISPECIES: methyltransferase domain-containing protein [unclassified Roseobacter]